MKVWRMISGIIANFAAMYCFHEAMILFGLTASFDGTAGLLGILAALNLMAASILSIIAVFHGTRPVVYIMLILYVIVILIAFAISRAFGDMFIYGGIAFVCAVVSMFSRFPKKADD